MSRARPLLVCLLVIACLGVASVAAAPAEPTLVEVYPNTNHDGNAGEYVVIDFPDGSDPSAFSLTDGETTTPLGNGTVSGPVAFSRSPEITREKVDVPVFELPEHFAMAQSGETIRLHRGSELVDETTYERASPSERWVLTDAGWEWRARGATAFEARDHSAERATAFALPDSPEVPIETLASADERLYLAGYSFHSEPASEALIAAHDRGVEVRVLVDGTPVGGQTEAEADALDQLVEAGIDVRVFDGPATRYRFHHPKYAVVDDRALVLTENWKPTGTGGGSSRGWGVVVDDRRTMVGSINWNANSVENNREVAVIVDSEGVASHFAAVFDADWGGESEGSIPVGIGLGVAAAVGVAVVVGSRVLRFEG
ncbi:phospholipase D-like domain-containing protein [Halalkalicoccus subterraneus]|uniref:phospholipase D-like domain-containing protein n=1 Tax=Halalkalicoccus subterraneus TaxID=2675002 RepID=UPI000EFBD418|nr:phospholipase D-like domain-containing protein [Halalkalicoccus subterraneus]